MKNDIKQFKKINNSTFKQVVKLGTELKEIKIELAKPKKEFFTKKEIAEIFNISERTIDRYRGQGLKFLQSGRNGKVLFKIEEVEKYLAL